MTPFCLFFGLALIFQNIAESGASTGTSTSSNDILLRPMSEWTLIPSARLGDKAALWTKLAREAESREQGRLVIVSETLNGVTGVYKDKEKARPLGLEKAVMVNVIAFSGTEDSNSRWVHSKLALPRLDLLGLLFRMLFFSFIRLICMVPYLIHQLLH